MHLEKLFCLLALIVFVAVCTENALAQTKKKSSRVSKSHATSEQRPPLTITPGEQCHIRDALPLLNKNYYKSKGYQLKKLNLNPLIIEETIIPSRSFKLRIEQRGCEDYYMKFTFVFKDKADQKKSIRRNVKKAVQVLKNLRISTDAHSRDLTKMIRAVEEEAGYVKSKSKSVVCLLEVTGECITDVSVKYRFPQLQIFYVDRP